MLLFVLFALSNGEWIETTQQDFSDGWFSRNIYASHAEGGALEFVGRWDFNVDGYIDVAGDDWIMWGDSGGYSGSNVTDYSVAGGGLYGGSDCADLDGDGYPEFLTTTMCGMVRIFWGSNNGPDPYNVTSFDVPGYNNEGAAIADLNKDGYLDLVISCFDDDNTGIFWGSEDGYSMSNVTLLPVNESGFNPEAADLNKDGWLDVIVIAGNTYQGQKHFIYYGSAEGFSLSNRTTVEYGHGGPHGMSVADLNYDGWLDLVYQANIPYYSGILWGGKDVFKAGIEVEADYVLPLPDRAYGGSSINHLNDDEYLDIVYFGNDGVPPRIFWGDESGISPDRYTDLGKDFPVGAGGIVADFNYDGHMDLFEYNRGGPSCFFWGPHFEPSQEYPMGAHHGFSREIGSIYYRQLKEIYYSDVHDTRMDLHWLEIDYDACCPQGCEARVAIRTGAHPDDFKPGPAIMSSHARDPWIDVANKEVIDMGCNDRYIQYRVTFEYRNPAYLPSIQEVCIRFEGEPLEIDNPNPIDAEGNIPGGEDQEFSVSYLDGFSQWGIQFTSSAGLPANISIYDINGTLISTILNTDNASGSYSFVWDGQNSSGQEVPQGVYFVHLVQPDGVQTAKIVRTR